MPDDVQQSLPPLIENLILDSRIRSLEDGLLAAERTRPDDPLLPSGGAILYAMKHERQCRQDAYAAMLDADEAGALFEAETIRRTGVRHEGV